MQTHFAVIYHAGDPGADHPNPELRGRGPSLDLIAAGPEEHCWAALREWTTRHPLRRGESAEVVERLSMRG